MHCFLFVEDEGKVFHRYDIINRVVSLLKTIYRDCISLFAIRRNTSLWELFICKQDLCEKMYVDTSELQLVMKNIIGLKRLILFSEDGVPFIYSPCISTLDSCILMGLHRGLNYETLKELGLKIDFIVSLGNISYITSHCIYIISYLERLCRYK